MRTLHAAAAIFLTAFFVPAELLPAAAQGRGGPCFFEHSEFQGRRLCLAPGQRLSNLDASWNDRISSVEIPPGMRVTVCEHANFAGRCMTLNRSVSDFQEIRFNDMVSSISVDIGMGQGGGQGGPPRGRDLDRGYDGPQIGRGPGPGVGHRDELRARMFDYRIACERGDRGACVRLGIIIGENRERRAQGRHESPELFWWDR